MAGNDDKSTTGLLLRKHLIRHANTAKISKNRPTQSTFEILRVVAITEVSKIERKPLDLNIRACVGAIADRLWDLKASVEAVLIPAHSQGATI